MRTFSLSARMYQTNLELSTYAGPFGAEKPNNSG
jgi:hypothetical protein